MQKLLKVLSTASLLLALAATTGSAAATEINWSIDVNPYALSSGSVYDYSDGRGYCNVNCSYYYSTPNANAIKFSGKPYTLDSVSITSTSQVGKLNYNNPNKPVKSGDKITLIFEAYGNDSRTVAKGTIRA